MKLRHDFANARVRRYIHRNLRALLVTYELPPHYPWNLPPILY
jgi:hypothetical protein